MPNLMNKAIVALFFVAFMAVSAEADSLDVGISQGAFLYNADSSQARLMLKFAMPEELDSSRILFAELRIPITTMIPDSSAITIYCKPIMIPWNPENTSWETLGDTPDSTVVSKKGTHFGTAEIGAVTAYFDISRIVKKWQDQTMPNHGLVIYANPRQTPRFTHQRQGNEPYATVRVEYELRPVQ